MLRVQLLRQQALLLMQRRKLVDLGLVFARDLCLGGGLVFAGELEGGRAQVSSFLACWLAARRRTKRLSIVGVCGKVGGVAGGRVGCRCGDSSG